MVLLQQKGTAETCRKVCDFVGCSSPGMHTSPWVSLRTEILMSCLALGWKKSCLSFSIAIFLLSIWVLWTPDLMLGGQTLEQVAQAVSFPEKIPKKLLLSCFTWRCFEQVGLDALQRSPPAWAVILYQEHKFWINSDWQMLFLLMQVLRWCHFEWALNGLKEPGNCDLKSETPELLHLKMFCLTAQLVSAHCVQHLWKRCLRDWKGNKITGLKKHSLNCTVFSTVKFWPKTLINRMRCSF